MFSMSSALHFCFAAYYVFNITFPSDFSNMFLFLETFVYYLKSSVSKLPLCVVGMQDNLRRIEQC